MEEEPRRGGAGSAPPAWRGPESVHWINDAALISCGDGGDFVRWFSRSKVGDEWLSFICRVPLGRIYEVADEARRRASAWEQFAEQLESRLR